MKIKKSYLTHPPVSSGKKGKEKIPARSERVTCPENTKSPTPSSISHHNSHTVHNL
jgi:hypothetical protein